MTTKEARVVRSVKNSRKSSTKKEAKTTSKEKSSKSKEYSKIDDVLAELTGKQIDEILLAHSQKTGKTKKDGIKQLVELAEELGNSAFIAVLQNGGVKLLRQIAEDLEIKAAASRKKEQLVDEIKKEYEELGQSKFLGKLTLDCLNDICEEMDFNEAEAKKDAVEDAIIEESFILGMKAALVKLPKESLVKIAKDVEVHHTGNKDKVAMNIIALAYPHLGGGAASGDDEGPKKTTGPKLAKIEQGVTSEDLMQYYVKDLTNYCDANGLRKSGGKSAIIRNILKFLDGDIEGTRKLKPGERRKKRRSTKKGAEKRKRDESSSDESDQEDEKTENKKDDKAEEEEEEQEKEKEQEKTKSSSSRASKRTRF